MPEYLAPGVYVEEYDANVHPIPGVSTSVDDATAQALIERLKELVPPDWSGFDEYDPGITLVNLFAWLSESLLYRTGTAVDARREAALGLLLSLRSCGPLVRPRYFAGQMLTAETLEAEQNYHREKQWRHNLALLGFGVVSGLSVQVNEDGGGPRVVVEPGYAIDPQGDEIALCTCVALRLPTTPSEAFVSLRGWDRQFAPVPTSSGSEDTRIEEACVIAISKCAPATAVPLAHLVRGPAGWTVDASFTALRVRSGCLAK